MAVLSGCDGIVIITREVAYGVYVDVGLSLFFVFAIEAVLGGLVCLC